MLSPRGDQHHPCFFFVSTLFFSVCGGLTTFQLVVPSSASRATVFRRLFVVGRMAMIFVML